LLRENVEGHVVHRQQAAKAHAQVVDLQEGRAAGGRRSGWRGCGQGGAHAGTSTWWRFMGSRPCGRQIIMTIMTRPKISMRYSENSRATSGSTVSRMAATITPNCEPMPPSTTMARISADSMKVNDSGLTMPWRAAKK